jgi:hypothetical protein
MVVYTSYAALVETSRGRFRAISNGARRSIGSIVISGGQNKTGAA